MKKTFKFALLAAMAGFMGAQAATQYGPVTIETVGSKTVATIDGSSLETVDIPEDVVVDSVVYNREFKKGVTATVMLPFDIDTWRVKNVTCFKYVKVTKDWDGNEYVRAPWVVYINHPYPQIMEANTPYLVLPNKDMDRLEIDIGHDHSTVTFNTTTNSRVVEYSDKYGSWNFVGTYDYKQWNEGDPELGRVYGFAANNVDSIKAGEFVKGAAGIKIRPMRAYLKCMKTSNVAAAKSAAFASIDEDLPETMDVRIMTDEEDAGEGTTSIPFGTLDTKTGSITIDNGWFDMKGRRLDHKPTKKGTYYHKGQKVIVK